MFSSEDYYRKCADAEGTDRILMLIQSMRRDIRRLKNKIEKSYISGGEPLDGSEHGELAALKECFESEKAAYIRDGGRYEMSNAEKKAQNFNDRLINIASLDFEICSEGYAIYKRTVVFEGEDVWFDCYYDSNSGYNEPVRIKYDGCSRIDFINALETVSIGEWKLFYSDRYATEGTSWNLDIAYSDGTGNFKSSGVNAWPYNFYALEQLLGVPV